MKNLMIISFFFCLLLGCQDAPKSAPANEAPKPTAAEPIAPADTSKKQPDEALINDLAAFYTGNLPCVDCDDIQTTLTLNADPQRSYSLEEEYKGKKGKTVESSGTWTVANGVVTLTGKTGKQQYELTKEGLVSFNTDGTKRDAKSASKYLLKKVLGE